VTRAHDTRTISLCIKVVELRDDAPPQENVIFTDRHSHDLDRPDPWTVEDERLLDGVRYTFRVIINVVRESREFYPGERRSYLLLSADALGSIDPPPPDIVIRDVESNSWLDESTINAGSWLRIGPLQRGARHFLDFYVQFAP
jgi:hypothetical protein